jgi:hypothetical protein
MWKNLVHTRSNSDTMARWSSITFFLYTLYNEHAFKGCFHAVLRQANFATILQHARGQKSQILHRGW